jgi:hypothetical protein
MSDQKLSLRQENNQLVNDCRNLFWELIELTGQYFLSDCVEEAGDYLSDREMNRIIKLRDSLDLKCMRKGIDFHKISQDVGQEFLESQKLVITHEDVIAGLKEIYKTYEECCNDPKALETIENAILLIRIHVTGEDD